MKKSETEPSPEAGELKEGIPWQKRGKGIRPKPITTPPKVNQGVTSGETGRGFRLYALPW